MSTPPTARERRIAEWSEPRFSRMPVPMKDETAVLGRGRRAYVFVAWLFSMEDRSRKAGNPGTWILVVGLCIWYSSTFHATHPVATALLLLSVSTLGIATVWAARLASKALSPTDLNYGARVLADALPDTMPGLAVRLSLSVAGHPYAEDTGVLALTDGWLIFEGCRTDFSLAPADGDACRPLEPVQARSRAEFRIEGLDADVRVLVQAVDLKDSAITLLSMWSAASVPPNSVSVLPPLEPIPGGASLSQPSTVLRALMVVSSMTAVTAFLSALLWTRAGSGSHPSPSFMAYYLVAFLLVMSAPRQLAKLKGCRPLGRGRALARLAQCRQRVLEGLPAGQPDPDAEGASAIETRLQTLVAADGSPAEKRRIVN